MTVAVVIVNWNGGGLLRQCLEALARQRRLPDRIIVVDNGSSDDSLSRAQVALQQADVIRLPENVGFAKANNLAVKAAAGSDAIALLNADAFPEPGWLDALVSAAEREPAVAAFASQIRFDSNPAYLDGAGDSYHVSGRAWRNGHRLASAAWPSADADVFAPCAAAALYRRDAFDEVGGFDEQYCYFEDADLGFRLRLRGHLPLRPFRRCSSRRSGLERLSQRLCGLSRRTERGLDLCQEHARPAALALSAAASGAQHRRPDLLRCARRARLSSRPSSMPCAASAPVLRQRRLVQRTRRVTPGRFARR